MSTGLGKLVGARIQLREATMKSLPVLLICCAVLTLACPSSAQICMPAASPEPESGYSYIRTELVALKWVRAALAETDKFQWIKQDDPQRLHKSVEFYSSVNTVSDDYGCAASLVSAYKDSKNESIRESANSILLAIETTKGINATLIGMMEKLNKATKAEDINQTEIAKTFADLKSLQSNVRSLMMLSAKMSTFGILRIEGSGEDQKPVAFLITAGQKSKLLEDIRQLGRMKDKDETYVDACVDIISAAIAMKLPTA